MQKLILLLQGKKAYLIMGATILYAVIGVALGFMSLEDAATLVLGALGLGALRAGVAKK